jgi:long-chain acyl-CoA synthetase
VVERPAGLALVRAHPAVRDISQASAIAYSKPIGKIMLVDLQRVNRRGWDRYTHLGGSESGVYQNVKGKSPVAKALFHFFDGSERITQRH